MKAVLRHKEVELISLHVERDEDRFFQIFTPCMSMRIECDEDEGKTTVTVSMDNGVLVRHDNKSSDGFRMILEGTVNE